MNVVHVIVGLNVGGAEHMLRRLVLAQRAADPTVACTVVSLTTLGPVGQMLRDAGIEVVPLGMRSLFGLPAALWRLTRLLRRRHPDLVQTWMVHADLVGGLAARWVGLRAVVWGIRTTDFSFNPPATRAVRWLCARLSTHVPHTIVCAAEASRRAHVKVGYDARRMVVIANGFDLDALQPQPALRLALRSEVGLAPDAAVVGCLGRFHAAKDFSNFVAAAGRVAAIRPDARFLMVGRGIDQANTELTDWIRATGHADRFVLLGERRDVGACLAAMDVFVLSSLSEGFPNVVGEAMSMERPCVVTDVGDARQLVGDTGRVVPPRDPRALADAVLAVLALPTAEREADGRRARARIQSEFSLQRACERFTQLQAGVVADIARRASVRAI